MTECPCPVDIGTRLELLVDDYLVERLGGEVEFRLHRPTPREVVFPNQPEPIIHEEGHGLRAGHAYMTVLQDGDIYRMYYAVSRSPQGLKGPRPRLYHYAESRDGVHWETPSLGLFEYEGSTDNNIFWCEFRADGFDAHSFSPFIDTHPDTPAEHRYKAVAYTRSGDDKGLVAMSSADGIRWSRYSAGFVITDGAFDTQNLAFWDGARGVYRAYWRDFYPGPDGQRYRGIKTASSENFLDWSTGQWLYLPGTEPEQLYTNQVIPYVRAPHVLVGLPTRYVARPDSPAIEALPEPERRRAVMEKTGMARIGTDLTDTLFMSSRDGVEFRLWGEAFVRPGLRPRDNWFYGDNYAGWGIVTTAASIPGAPDEMSFYLSEGNRREHDSKVYRRYTLRQDGFVSVCASRRGGELLTRPLVFGGEQLLLNFSASAAGGLRVELQDERGVAIPGYSLAECVDVLGDDLERPVQWNGGAAPGALAGKPVKVRVSMVDADLFAFRFR